MALLVAVQAERGSGMQIVLEDGTVVPESALEWSFSRSSGPGGQRVNKVSSRVELRVDLAALPEELARRLSERYPRRVDREKRFLVTSSRHREQWRNRLDAVAKFRRCAEEALRERKPRLPTVTPPSVRRRRLESKRRRARIKALRRRVDVHPDEG
jgi:ribosome-associated protein